MKHRVLVICCLAWAAIGMAVAALGLGAVNDDARLLVYSATAIGVGSAIVAARLAAHDQVRWCGVALVISVVIPTWFAAYLNIVPLVAGIALIAMDRWGSADQVS